MEDGGVEYIDDVVRDLSRNPIEEAELRAPQASPELWLASLMSQNISVPALGVADFILLPPTEAALRRRRSRRRARSTDALQALLQDLVTALGQVIVTSV